MSEASSKQAKDFYKAHPDTSWVKRYESRYLLRRYFYRTRLSVTAKPVKSAYLVLDAGCGDGVLSVLIALWHPHQKIIAMDISEECVRAAREAAIAHGVAERMAFVVADAEHLPFKDGSLPAVISSHVLEHLPNFDQGVREISRVLQGTGVGVIAIPTCLNPSAMALLGGDGYWRVSRHTLLALWKGMARVVIAWLKGEEGVQEGYAGHFDLPHLWHFPWRAIRRVERNHLTVTHWMADSLLVPYLAHLFPPVIRLQRWVDEKLRAKGFWRNFGVGIVMIVSKR